MVIFHPFIGYYIFGSNNEPPMSASHKELSVLLQKKFQGILPTTILSSLKTLESLILHNKFVTYVYRRHRRHEMSASPFTVWGIFYSTKKGKKSEHFCYHLCVETSCVIYNCSEYNNIQYSMLYHPDNNNINIQIYYQETLPTFI